MLSEILSEICNLLPHLFLTHETADIVHFKYPLIYLLK